MTSAFWPKNIMNSDFWAEKIMYSGMARFNG